MELLDFGAIARSGMAQVPDYAAQQAQQQQMRLLENQQRLAQQTQLFKQQQDQREVDEEDAYQNDLSVYLKSNNPQDLINLSVKYPKKSEAIKRSFDAQDKVVRDADLRQSVSILGYINNGRADMAAKSLEDRIAKGRAAGEQDDPQDTAILESLKSGDPDRIKEAQGLITYQVSAITGAENFSKTFKDLNPEDKKDPLQKKVEYLRSQGRDDLAEAALTEQGLLTVPGAGVYRISDFAGGGGQASTVGAAPTDRTAPDIVKDGRSAIETIFPGITVTDNVRDPNSKLGKANPNSFHVKTGGAVDVKPIPGMTFPQFISQIKSAGYKVAEAKNEVGKGRSKWATGDHWHVVLSGGPGIPAKVKTKQQFEKLASGTVFIAPDGSRRVKP
jgi:hypothetical protein